MGVESWTLVSYFYRLGYFKVRDVFAYPFDGDFQQVGCDAAGWVFLCHVVSEWGVFCFIFCISDMLVIPVSDASFGFSYIHRGDIHAQFTSDFVHHIFLVTSSS